VDTIPFTPLRYAADLQGVSPKLGSVEFFGRRTALIFFPPSRPLRE